jgi:hypothetical protein
MEKRMTEEKPTKAGQIKLEHSIYGLPEIQYVSVWDVLTKSYQWKRVL